MQILLSKLVLGASSQSVLHFLDPGRAARHFAGVSSLRVVVRDCADPSFTVHRQRVRLLLPAQPMRAAPPTGAAPLTAVLATLTEESGYALVEPKFDGYRLQLHVAGGGSTVRCFYRSGVDCTGVFGRLLGRLVPRLTAEEVVLDGEVLMWDATDGTPVHFKNIRPALTELENALLIREKGGLDDRNVSDGTPLPTSGSVGGGGGGALAGGSGSVDGGGGCNDGRGGLGQLPFKLMFMVFDILYYKHRQSTAAVAAAPTANYARFGDMDDDAPLPKRPRPPDPDSVLTMSLEQRLELLSTVLGKAKLITPDGAVGILRVTREEVRGNEAPAQAVAAMWRFVEAGFEGAVAKNPIARYLLGGRDPRVSVKLKPDFFEGGVPDLDVLILGANFGMGLSRSGNSRAGRPSTFVVGVAMEEPRGGGSDWAVDSPAPHPTRFRVVGRVGTGYSYSQLEELQELLAPHWQPLDPKSPPTCFADWAGTSMKGSNVPQVWIPPEHSRVLTVKCYSLAEGSMNMRFPRVVRIRHDKAWHEAMTWGELILCKNETTGPPPPDKIMLLAQGRAKRHAVSEGAAAAPAAVDPAKVGRRTVAPAFRSPDASTVAVTSDIFAGLTFRVAAEASAKHKLERTILAAGGELRQNMDPDVTYMVATSTSDVTVAAWIRLCAGADGIDAAGSADPFGVGDSQGSQTASPWPTAGDSGGSLAGVAAVGSNLPLGSQVGSQGLPPASGSRPPRGGRRSTARVVAAAGGPRAVIRDTYITSCVAAGRRLPLTAPALLYAPPDVAATVAAHADIVGDPWREPTTAASLAAALPAVAAAVDADPSLLAPLASGAPSVTEAHLAAAAGLVFVGVVVAVSGGDDDEGGGGGPAAWAGVPGYPPATLPAALMLAAYGGVVRWLPPAGGDPPPGPPVTHALVHTRRVWCDGGAAAAAAAAPLPVVSERWVRACVRHRRRLPPFV